MSIELTNQLPLMQLHIVLPSLTTMQTVLTRLGKISSTVTISANRSGHLRMGIESDQANVTTEWSNLRHPEFNQDETSATPVPSNLDPVEYYSVSLNAKSLAKFLSSRAIASTAIACECLQHSICGVSAC